MTKDKISEVGPGAEYPPEIYEEKQSNMLKSSLLFKKSINLQGKQLENSYY